MGVKGLWSLLLPIGRRVSIETLEGRVLAIDASIWLTQFLKANRDPDSGTVRPGAHLLGFIRRICKLLYHGIRPVFVFDGATPEIKLREVRARRERRDRMTIGVGGSGGLGNDGSIKRMARKLLVTELKKNKELERAKALNLSGKAGTGGGFAPNFNPDIAEEEKGEDSANESAVVYERGNARTHGPTREAEKAGSSKDGSNMIDLSNADEIFESQVQNDWDDDKPNQEIFGDGETSSSSESVQIPREEEEIDFGAIATLPANVRKDIIEKAKRQQRLRTRKEFMPVAADPVAYSQVQLTSFLRSSRLNKTINDAAVKATKGLGDGDGLEGECIASDSTKRFIFIKESDQNCANETADKTGGREQTSRATYKSDGSNTYVLPSSSHRQRIRRKGRSQDSSDDDDLFLFEGRLGSPSHQVAKGGRKQFAESDEGDSENSSIERGGGFLIEDETSSAKLGSASPKLPRSSSLVRKNEDEIQQKNDEMIARALQEEEGDSAIPIDDSEEKDSVYAVEISDFGGTVVSHQHENNDALLAATLQRQEEKAISSGSFFDSEEVPIQIDDSDDEMDSAQGEGENSINEYKLSITALHDEDERGVDYGDTSDDDVDWEDADVGESLTSYVQAPKDGNSPLAVRAQITHVRNQPAMDQDIAGASTSCAEAAVRNHLVSAGGKNVHVLSSPSLQMEPPVPKASANHNSDDKNDNENRTQDNFTARSSSHPSNRRRNMSETDGEVEADLTSDFDLAPSNDANAAALKQAQSTATNLTNWAGRAVRRAIAAHIEETGGGESQPSNMHVEDNAISAPLTNMKKGCTEEGTGKGRAKSSVQKYAVGDEKDGVAEHMEEDQEKQFRLDTAKDAMNNDAIVPSTDVVVPQTLNNSATVFQDSPVKTSLEALTEEHDRLQDDINRQQRDMDTVTDEMKEEIVELLQAFGIPYVEAPAEAEAQCCTLENLRLVDGVVVRRKNLIPTDAVLHCTPHPFW
jgi:DNA excision repair protein ERCC-5